jgi:hypothetical protein
MKDYTTITANNNGQPFPDTRAIDSSGPLATDGTEIVEEVINDIWLEKQALIDFYYPFPLGPDGSEDLPGVDAGGLPKSQPLAAQYMNFGTPGTIVNWPSQEDPTLLGISLGIDIRLLLLQGQGIDRTLDDFKMLDSIVYIGDPDNATADAFYHADDVGGTIRNTAGQYLILPDAKGYSFRALDPSGTIDPDGASRIVGSIQDDALQNIVGEFYLRQKNIGPNEIVLDGILSGLFTVTTAVGDSSSEIESTPLGGPIKTLNQVDFNTSGVAGLRTATESRAKNIATNFAIHY